MEEELGNLGGLCLCQGSKTNFLPQNVLVVPLFVSYIQGVTEKTEKPTVLVYCTRYIRPTNAYTQYSRTKLMFSAFIETPCMCCFSRSNFKSVKGIS